MFFSSFKPLERSSVVLKPLLQGKKNSSKDSKIKLPIHIQGQILT